jgi:prepilin-type N-terminal cleavage/methylation domain-containing protein
MRGKKGFTLIEITVALLILAFILFSLGVLIPLSQVRIRNTAHRDMALALAEDVIGKIRALNWEDIPFQEFIADKGDAFIMKPPVIGVQIFPPEPYPSKECSFDSTDQGGGVTTHTVTYLYRVTVEPANDPDAPAVLAEDLKKVTVVISWEESSGSGGSEHKKVTLQSTLYRRYGSDASAH